MAERGVPKGRLIALEGIESSALAEGGKKLVRACGGPKQPGGVSSWDASGVFFELSRTREGQEYPSMKTLLMLYASDLAFRLRWEIVPALEEGLIVVAAPYVQTATAMGAAAGVAADWCTALFRFAPKPEEAYSLPESEVPSYWKPKPAAGFVDFCCGMLAASCDEWEAVELRQGVSKYLGKLQKSGRLAAWKPK